MGPSTPNNQPTSDNSNQPGQPPLNPNQIIQPGYQPQPIAGAFVMPNEATPSSDNQSSTAQPSASVAVASSTNDPNNPSNAPVAPTQQPAVVNPGQAIVSPQAATVLPSVQPIATAQPSVVNPTNGGPVEESGSAAPSTPPLTESGLGNANTAVTDRQVVMPTTSSSPSPPTVPPPVASTDPLTSQQVVSQSASPAYVQPSSFHSSKKLVFTALIGLASLLLLGGVVFGLWSFLGGSKVRYSEMTTLNTNFDNFENLAITHPIELAVDSDNQLGTVFLAHHDPGVDIRSDESLLAASVIDMTYIGGALMDELSQDMKAGLLDETSELHEEFRSLLKDEAGYDGIELGSFAAYNENTSFGEGIRAEIHSQQAATTNADQATTKADAVQLRGYAVILFTEESIITIFTLAQEPIFNDNREALEVISDELRLIES